MVFDAIFNRDPVPVTHANPELPAEFRRILNKALEKDRNLRYPDRNRSEDRFSPASARHRPQPEDDR